MGSPIHTHPTTALHDTTKLKVYKAVAETEPN